MSAASSCLSKSLQWLLLDQPELSCLRGWDRSGQRELGEMLLDRDVPLEISFLWKLLTWFTKFRDRECADFISVFCRKLMFHFNYFNAI